MFRTGALVVVALRQPVADLGAHPPEVSGVGAQAADLGAHQPGFRCVLGLLIPRSQFRGYGGRSARGQGCCEESSNYPLSASIFSFSFRGILPIQVPLVQTSTWPLIQPSLALSQESCRRHCTAAGHFSPLVPPQVPGTLLFLSTLLTV